jgi:hypothetical protein
MAMFRPRSGNVQEVGLIRQQSDDKGTWNRRICLHQVAGLADREPHCFEDVGMGDGCVGSMHACLQKSNCLLPTVPLTCSTAAFADTTTTVVILDNCIWVVPQNKSHLQSRFNSSIHLPKNGPSCSGDITQSFPTLPSMRARIHTRHWEMSCPQSHFCRLYVYRNTPPGGVTPTRGMTRYELQRAIVFG